MARDQRRKLQQSPSPVPSRTGSVGARTRKNGLQPRLQIPAQLRRQMHQDQNRLPTREKRCAKRTCTRLRIPKSAVHCDGWSNAKAVASRASANDGNLGSS